MIDMYILSLVHTCWRFWHACTLVLVIKIIDQSFTYVIQVFLKIPYSVACSSVDAFILKIHIRKISMYYSG